MTPAQLASYVRFKTRTDDTTFTDAEIQESLRVKIEELVPEIIKRNEDFFGVPYFTDLIADQREYPMPDEILQVKYVEVNLDGSEWKHCDNFDLNSFPQNGGGIENPLDLGEIQPRSLQTTDEARIRELFTDDQPMYDIFRKSLWLYTGSAIADVTDGLKLWAIVYPTTTYDMTSTTDLSVAPSDVSHGIPRQFHTILATQVIVDWKTSRDKPIPLTEQEQKVELELARKLDAITNLDLNKATHARMPYMTGSDN